MALNLPNFRQLGDADYGGFDLGRAIKSGIETAWKPSQLAEELLKAKLANKINQPYADNAQRSFEADVGGREANMANTQQSTIRQKIMNQFLPENQKLDIESKRLTNQYYPQHEQATINNINRLSSTPQIKGQLASLFKLRDSLPDGKDKESVNQMIATFSQGKNGVGANQYTNAVKTANQIAMQNIPKSLELIKLLKQHPLPYTAPSYLGGNYFNADERALSEGLVAENKDIILKALKLPNTEKGLETAKEMLRRHDNETKSAYKNRLDGLGARLQKTYTELKQNPNSISASDNNDNQNDPLGLGL